VEARAGVPVNTLRTGYDSSVAAGGSRSLTGKRPAAANMCTMSTLTTEKSTSPRYPCHCCHKPESVYWSQKRSSFICENCLKTFDRAVIAKRNGLAVEQLTLC
jgi:hypothetical protein